MIGFLKFIGCFVVGGIGYWISAMIEPCRPWSDVVVSIAVIILAYQCYKHTTSPVR